MGDGGPDALQRSLGYTFSDPGLLLQALTHRSHTSEVPGESNERLEFLGDAVLGLIIAHELYGSFDLPEGSMAKARAEVVDSHTLADVASAVGLGEHLLLGQGEEATGGREKPSILADAMEAVIGAIYLDGGIEPARTLVLQRWAGRITDRAAAPGVRDSKTRLQEALAARGDVPEYQVEGEGPDHQRRFTATVSVEGRVLGSGRGTSKKRAEQDAARSALAALEPGDA